MHCIVNQHVLKVYLACIVSLLGEAQAGLLYRSLYLGSLLAPGVRAADLNIEFSKIPRRNVFLLAFSSNRFWLKVRKTDTFKSP